MCSSCAQRQVANESQGILPCGVAKKSTKISPSTPEGSAHSRHPAPPHSVSKRGVHHLGMPSPPNPQPQWLCRRTLLQSSPQIFAAKPVRARSVFQQRFYNRVLYPMAVRVLCPCGRNLVALPGKLLVRRTTNHEVPGPRPSDRPTQERKDRDKSP